MTPPSRCATKARSATGNHTGYYTLPEPHPVFHSHRHHAPQRRRLSRDHRRRVRKIIDLTADNPPQISSVDRVAYRLRQEFTAYKPLITFINMGDPSDHTGNSDLAVCKAYVDKLQFFGNAYSPGKIVISASRGYYGNNHYYFDDNHQRHAPVPSHTCANFFSFAVNAVLAADPNASVTYVGDCTESILSGGNVAGYMSWGWYNSGLDYGDYALPPLGQDKVGWTSGNSAWYIMQTLESYNGFRANVGGQGTFLKWFSKNAFGGQDIPPNDYPFFSNTPVGAVSNLNEPNGWTCDPAKFFGLWASGKNFAICAWGSPWDGFLPHPNLQAVGDPLVAR